MRKRRMKIILGVQIAFLVSLLVFGLSYSPRPDMASDTVYRSDMRAKEALQRNETLDRAVEAIYEDSIFNRATAAMVKVGAEDILVVATVATPEAPSILAGFALNVAEKDAVPLERPFEQRPELAARYLAELTTLEKAGLEAVAEIIRTQPKLQEQLGLPADINAAKLLQIANAEPRETDRDDAYILRPDITFEQYITDYIEPLLAKDTFRDLVLAELLKKGIRPGARGYTATGSQYTIAGIRKYLEKYGIDRPADQSVQAYFDSDDPNIDGNKKYAVHQLLVDTIIEYAYEIDAYKILAWPNPTETEELFDSPSSLRQIVEEKDHKKNRQVLLGLTLRHFTENPKPEPTRSWAAGQLADKWEQFQKSIAEDIMTEQGTMLDTKKIFGEKAKEEGFIPPFAHASARGYKFFDESPIPLGETLHEGAARFANPKAMVDLTPAQISVAVPELERVLSEDLGIDITTYAASYREDAFYIVRKLSEMKPEKLRAIGKESSRGLASLALELGMHQRQLPLPERDLLTTIPASGQPVGLADWMKAAFKTIKLETMETADRDTIALETKAILEAVETMDRQLRVAAIEGPAGEAVANLNQAKATAKKMVDDLNAIAKHISDVEARTSVVKLATETLNVISISSDIKIAKQVKFETPEKVLILHAGNALPDEQLSLYVEGGSLYDEQQVKLGSNAAVRYLKDVEKADIEEADYVVVVSDKTSAQIQDTHKGLGLEDEKVTCIKLPSSENPRALLPIPHINLAAKYTALCRDVTLGYQTDPGVMELLSGLYRIITPDPKFDIRRQLAAEIMIMSIRSLATVPINVKYEEMHRRMFYALWAV